MAGGDAFDVVKWNTSEYGPKPASLLAQIRNAYWVSSVSLTTLYEWPVPRYMHWKLQRQKTNTPKNHTCLSVATMHQAYDKNIQYDVTQSAKKCQEASTVICVKQK